MSLIIHDIGFDCADPRRQAEFWAAALRWQVQRAATWDAEISRGAKTLKATEDWSIIKNDVPGSPRIAFAKVPEAKVVKNRMHLDLRADDVRAEVARLVGLGASVICS